MYRALLACCLLFAAASPLTAQQSFRFLEQPATARALALGGGVITGPADAGLWLRNPALLDSTLSGQLLAGYQWFYADIRRSTMAYAQEFKQAGTFGLGVQYLDFGDMQGYDPAGEPTGMFSASDYVVQLSHARRWKVYQFGGSIKWASSGIGAYRANALLLDAGGIFRHPKKDFSAGFAVRNVGVITRSYTDAQQPELPLEVSMGLTFKPQFMPLRFSLTAQHLQQPKLAYADPASPFNKEEAPVVDNIMRHFSAGAELLMSKNINVRAGYSHRLRQELRLENVGRLSGFSLGFMLKVRSMRFDFTRAWYHATGGTNQVNLVADLNKIFQNKI